MISMILLPISVIFLGGTLGFVMTCLIILLQGLANAIVLSNLYAITSFLPFEFIIAFSTGQGFAGIIMNVTRYVILASFGANSETEKNIVLGSLIFFGISAFIIGMSIVFLLLVYKDPYFKSQMRNSGEFPIETNSEYAQLADSNGKLVLNENSAATVIIILIKFFKGVSEKSTTSSLMFFLLDLNFIIFLNYVITFGVFPGVSLMPNLL